MAQETVAPPGASAIDEYLETIPTTDGDRPSRTVGGEGDSSSGGALTARQRRALDGLGADGKQAARLADAVGSPAKRPDGEKQPGRFSADSLAGADEGRSPLGAIGSALGGGGAGFGAALPVILVLSALGAAYLGIRRRNTA